VVVDLETTGLFPEVDVIIEICAIKVDRENIDECSFYQTLVKTYKPITKKVSEITGLHDEELLSGKSIDTAIEGLLNFIGDLPIVCYNATFDSGFINQAILHKDVKLRFYCALMMAKAAFSLLDGYKLIDVYEAISHKNAIGAHRAINDCKMAALVYLKALEILGNPIKCIRPIQSSSVKTFPNDRRHSNSNGPFKGSRMVLTGEFSSSRDKFANLMADLGFEIMTTVSKKIKYLVVGSLSNGAYSKKINDAEALIQSGLALSIFSEDKMIDFVKNEY